MLFGPPLGLTVGDALTGGRSTSLLQFGATSTRLTLAFSIIGTLASVFVVSTLERLAAARASAERAQRVAAEAQLRLLQSQLEPHMLFNTLANLRVLIGVDAARAQAMLDHLNAYLRATLSASRAVQHPLADEFARLADYLALMAVRMGPRLQVRLDLPEELARLPVPPLLLQPLVENSIKHGLEPQVDGGRIDITARRVGQQLVLAVRDTGAGPGAAATCTDTSGGFGLVQVRERLATVCGGRASLTLQAAGDAEGGTLATLHLPLS
ncbi:MAG: histidine kinase [Betaproteobacteria bacterium]|nr:histidine kinase [Betaproteobacteria bacterium]